MSAIDDLARQILADVVADFRGRRLRSDALSEDYGGVSLAALEDKYCASRVQTKVDFDLAVKQLEASSLVKTGPMVPYDNPRGSQVFVIGLFSRREYIYLTEKGYREAQKILPKPTSHRAAVHISGGTFHNSPVGIGGSVNQTMTVNFNSDSEVVEQLWKLLTQHDPAAEERRKKEVVELVQVAKTGDLGKAKPMFQRLFGAAKETLKQVAWGIVTGYVNHQLGM